jgi:TPR repeat protein
MAFKLAQSVSGFCLLIISFNSGFTANVRIYVLMLIALMLIAPLAVQADDLFDSQMKLAKQGNAEAQFKVGEMYETGIGVGQDRKEAKYWLTRSANQNYETARYKLLYWDMERRGLNSENKIKVEELNTRAKQGNAQAQYYLGKMYAYGVGIKRNPDVAIDWLNKAALVGVIEAELELASLMEEKKIEAQKERRFKSDPCNDKTARFLSTCR